MVAIPPSLAAILVRSLAGATLHDSTLPDAIADAQRREVSDHLALHPGATAAEVGEALDLPTFSVEMRLAELRGLPVPYSAVSRRTRGLTLTPYFGPKFKNKEQP